MTSRFMQSAIAALNHATKNNPESVCSINFKLSTDYVYYHANIKTRMIVIDVKKQNGITYHSNYEIYRHYQRLWFEIIQPTETKEVFIYVD